MTQETKTTKDDGGFISLLKSIVSKGVDIPNDIVELAKMVKTLAVEMKEMSQVLSVISQVVYQHSVAIKELYAIQATIVKKSKAEVDVDLFPDAGKNKVEKPN